MGDEEAGWMVWGGKAPGGWCPVWNPGMELHRPDPQTGTREQAEETAARLRVDFPGFTYEVAPFDAEREPEAVTEGKLTEPQIAALKDTAEGKNPFNTWPRQHQRSTLNVLFSRGLIMHEAARTKPGGVVRITRAGREMLSRES